MIQRPQHSSPEDRRLKALVAAPLEALAVASLLAMGVEEHGIRLTAAVAAGAIVGLLVWL